MRDSLGRFLGPRRKRKPADPAIYDDDPHLPPWAHSSDGGNVTDGTTTKRAGPSAAQPAPIARRRWPWTAKVFGSLCSVLVAALGVLSAWLGIQNQSLQTVSAHASARADSQQTVIVNLQGDKQSLQTKYQTLQGQVAAAPGDTSAPSGAVLPNGVVPRHDDPALTIQTGESADLDAPASNPRWDSSGSSADIAFSNGELVTYNQAAILRLPDGTSSSYDACNVSGYSDSIALSLSDDAAPGQYFCVTTGDDRIAAAKITSLTDKSIVLSVKVWDPPLN